MDWVPLNFGLMKNPLNWIIILLMVYLGSILLSYADKQIFQLHNSEG